MSQNSHLELEHVNPTSALDGVAAAGGDVFLGDLAIILPSSDFSFFDRVGRISKAIANLVSTFVKLHVQKDKSASHKTMQQLCWCTLG
jgi:hypothetical protein